MKLQDKLRLIQDMNDGNMSLEDAAMVFATAGATHQDWGVFNAVYTLLTIPEIPKH